MPASQPAHAQWQEQRAQKKTETRASIFTDAASTLLMVTDRSKLETVSKIGNPGPRLENEEKTAVVLTNSYESDEMDLYIAFPTQSFH